MNSIRKGIFKGVLTLLLGLALTGLLVAAEPAVAPSNDKTPVVQMPYTGPIESPSILELDNQWEFLPYDISYDKLTSGLHKEDWGTARVPGYWTEAKTAPGSKLNWPGPADYSKGNEKLGPAYTTAFAWYRKKFTIPKELNSFNGRILLSGIKWNSQVWLNGHYLGSHQGGYAPFEFDISKHFKAGEENELLIRVGSYRTIPRTAKGLPAMMVGDLRTLSSRVAGITEPVALRFYKRAFIKSVFVIPHAKDKTATVRITLNNYDQIHPDDQLDIYLSTQDSLVPLQQVNVEIERDEANKIAGNEVTLTIPNAEVWWPWRPFLYKVVVLLKDKNNTPMDIEPVTFGLRDTEIKEGHYYLNGQRFQLRGATFPEAAEMLLGSEQSTDSTFIRKFLLELPRKGNIFALRVPNGPMTQDWLNICDEIGLMVVQDFPATRYSNQWEDTTFGMFAMKEYQDMLPLYWNHPSIALWSLSNQSWDSVKRSVELSYLYPMIKRLDPSRPVLRGGDETPDGVDIYMNDGMENLSLSEFRKKAEAMNENRKAQGKFCSGYLDAASEPNGTWKNDKLIKLHFGAKATPAEMSYKHAEIAAEQTEILRMNQFDGLFPGEYGDWTRLAEWDSTKNKQKFPQPKLTYQALKNAMSPVAACLDLRTKQFKVGQTLSLPVKAVNSTPGRFPVKLEIMLVKENPNFDPAKAKDLGSKTYYYSSSTAELTGFTIAEGTVLIALDKKMAGTCYLLFLVTRTDTNEATLSQRKIEILK
jgi:hypothetical protein